jgi:hypothetical protein
MVLVLGVIVSLLAARPNDKYLSLSGSASNRHCSPMPGWDDRCRANESYSTALD